MDEAPATLSPNVSGDSDANMDTDEEEDLLSYRNLNGDSDSDEDGFQHV